MSFDELLETSKKMEVRLGEMQFQLDQLNRLLFGAKRERFIKKTDEDHPDAWLCHHISR